MILISDDFQIGPDGAYEHTVEHIAEQEFNEQITNPEEAFFHFTDKDIWIQGFLAGYKLADPKPKFISLQQLKDIEKTS